MLILQGKLISFDLYIKNFTEKQDYDFKEESYIFVNNRPVKRFIQPLKYIKDFI